MRHSYPSPRQLETQDYRQRGTRLDVEDVAQEVDHALFWHPSFVLGADRRSLQDLERACDGWRTDEDGDTCILTTRWLPHWRIGPSLEKVDPQNPGIAESEQGLAVVVRGDEARPTDIYYFDNQGRVVGYRSTAYHSPQALGKDQRMHPADYVHTGWALNDADQVERQWQVIQWTNKPLEVMEDWNATSWARAHEALIPETQR